MTGISENFENLDGNFFILNFRNTKRTLQVWAQMSLNISFRQTTSEMASH